MPGVGAAFVVGVAAAAAVVGVHIALRQQIQDRLSAHAGVEHATGKAVQLAMLGFAEQRSEVHILYVRYLFERAVEILNLFGYGFPLRLKLFVGEVLFGFVILGHYVQQLRHILQGVVEGALEPIVSAPELLPVLEAIRNLIVRSRRVIQRIAQAEYVVVVARVKPLEVRNVIQ